MAAEQLQTRSQEITASTIAPLPEGSDLVRPYDSMKIYSTGKTKHLAEGEEMEVHPLLAEKLIAAGKATEKSSKKK